MATLRLINNITKKITQHHKLYRFPVKAELWEDIFDQVINGIDSEWEGGGHSTGADVISEGEDETRYQNKSGDINCTAADDWKWIKPNAFKKYVFFL